MRSITYKAASPALARQALRFGLSGLLVTGLHASIASAFIKIVLPRPSLANGTAFVIATVFSYLINTKWSFSSSLNRKNLFRFCAVSLVGLFLAMTVSGIADAYGLHYGWGIAFVICTVPIVTFILHRFWTFW